MRSDPRIGYWISLGIAGLSGLWLFALWPFSEDMEAFFGMAVHAITFLAIFLLLTGLAVSLLFSGYVRIKSDLAAGRNVLARWHVDRGTWRQFAGPADAMNRSEKTSLLLMLYAFIAVICGGLALAIPKDWHIFGWIALGMAAVVTVAFLLGNRVYERQLVYRTGEIIIGRDGMSVDGVLHVWGNWLSWLEGAEVIERPVKMLIVAYSFWTRYGWQTVTARAPIIAGDIEQMHALARTLNEAAGRMPRRKRKGNRVRESASH